MENKQPVSILEKILYGQKVTNDNIVVINEKIDALIKMMSFTESEPTASGTEN